jgi:hypothetical protein
VALRMSKANKLHFWGNKAIHHRITVMSYSGTRASREGTKRDTIGLLSCHSMGHRCHVWRACSAVWLPFREQDPCALCWMGPTIPNLLDEKSLLELIVRKEHFHEVSIYVCAWSLNSKYLLMCLADRTNKFSQVREASLDFIHTWNVASRLSSFSDTPISGIQSGCAFVKDAKSSAGQESNLFRNDTHEVVEFCRAKASMYQTQSH